MTGILKLAASGLLAQQRNLDVIANNIANVGTTGFKKSRAVFTDTDYQAPQITGQPGTVDPLESQTGTGVTFAAAQRLFPQGNLKETENPWDLAIAGDGFFQVTLPDGRRAYTRDGSLQVDAAGHLATMEGFLVEPAITVPPDAKKVTIQEDGMITAEVNGQQSQLGRIDVVTFPNPAGLLAVGHDLFVPSGASGAAQPGQAGTGSRGQILSGVLENSNVDMAEEMTRTIEAQRAYQLSIKILQTADEMLAMANNLRR